MKIVYLFKNPHLNGPERHKVIGKGILVRQHKASKPKEEKRASLHKSPIEVCRILTDCDISDVRILCAAILHDTIEDTDTTEEEIEN